MLEILREQVNVLVKLEQIVDFFVFCTKVKIEVRVYESLFKGFVTISSQFILGIYSRPI